jgi:hypothetical protein
VEPPVEPEHAAHESGSSSGGAFTPESPSDEATSGDFAMTGDVEHPPTEPGQAEEPAGIPDEVEPTPGVPIAELPQEQAAEAEQPPTPEEPSPENTITYPLPVNQALAGVYSNLFNHAYGQNIVGGLNINGDNADLPFDGDSKILTNYKDCEDRCVKRIDCAAYVYRNDKYPEPWRYVCVLKQAPTAGITTGWDVGLPEGAQIILGTRILNSPTHSQDGPSASNVENQPVGSSSVAETPESGAAPQQTP